MSEVKFIHLGCSMKEESKDLPFYILPIYYLDRLLRFASMLCITAAMMLYKVWDSKRRVA